MFILSDNFRSFPSNNLNSTRPVGSSGQQILKIDLPLRTNDFSMQNRTTIEPHERNRASGKNSWANIRTH